GIDRGQLRTVPLREVPCPAVGEPPLPTDVGLPGRNLLRRSCSCILPLVCTARFFPIAFELLPFGQISRNREDAGIISRNPMPFANRPEQIRPRIPERNPEHSSALTEDLVPLVLDRANFSREGGNGLGPVLVCSPKPGPGAMRVSDAP